MSKRAVKKLLQTLLEIPAEPGSNRASFPILFDEPDNCAVRAVLAAAQANYFCNLPEKQKTYLECSLPRLKFAVDRVLKYVPIGSSILDLGCSPGYLSILLDTLGYQVLGVDLNDLYFAHYPDRFWISLLKVQTVDVERRPLPFPSASFDAVLFTEVLEHVAITDPGKVLQEIQRVLKPEAYLFLTTPNVANLANIIALARGKNVFWAPEIFYGSTDRHNREYTPDEVLTLLESQHFRIVERFLFNGPNNWNGAASALIYEFLDSLRAEAGGCPLLGNTIFVVSQPPSACDIA